jgi:bacteriocin-like protein
MSQEPENPENEELNEEKLKKVSGGKLSIGKTGDKFEREADQVSDKVMNEQQAPAPPGQGTP